MSSTGSTPPGGLLLHRLLLVRLVSDGLAGQVDALVQLLSAEEGRQVGTLGFIVGHRLLRFAFEAPVDQAAGAAGVGAAHVAVALLGSGLGQVALSQELLRRLAPVVLLHAGGGNHTQRVIGRNNWWRNTARLMPAGPGSESLYTFRGPITCQYAVLQQQQQQQPQPPQQQQQQMLRIKDM